MGVALLPRGRAPRRVPAFVATMAMVLVATAACGGGDDSSSGTDKAAGSKIDTAKTVYVMNSTPDETNLPVLMAIDAMKAAGYDLSIKQLEGSNLPFQALSSNQAQLTGASLPEGALSVEAGAPVRIVSTRNANQVVWVARNEFKDCADLDGEKVGIFSETGGYTVLMRLYFKKACPDVKPRYVVIPDSPLRAQAVAENKLAGTTLGLSDAVALQDANPDGEFFLLPLSGEIPGVGDEYVYSNQQTLKDHPTIVARFVEEQLKATRQLYAEPDRLASIVAKLLPDAKGPKVAQAMVDAKLWYANGGLDGPGMKDTLAGFELPGAPSDLTDPTPMTTALESAGKSDATQY
jgi:ABC-type nitrate/sulfonate/bicarbonate transport system substrate-binding protein